MSPVGVAPEQPRAEELPVPVPEAPTGVYVRRDGLFWYWNLLAFVTASFLIVARDPSVLSHPQFFAEDGHVFFADAYNLGWASSCFRTYAGYFNLVPRVGAGVALLVPLHLAPLVLNLIGLVVQVLPVPILLSRRSRGFGPLAFRAVMVLLYIALPNSRETNVSITFVQWHLALAACLLLVAEVPQNRLLASIDTVFFVIVGLTGPFALLLCPVAFLTIWMKREPLRWLSFSALAGAAVIQLRAMMFCDPRGLGQPLGASAEGFARILAGHVYLGAILGSNVAARFGGTGWLAAICICGTLLVLYCCLRAPKELTLFVTFAAVVLAVSLLRPGIEAGTPGSAWEILASAPAIRYWLIPCLAFAWTLAWYAFSPNRSEVNRSIGVVLLSCMLFGVGRDWRYRARPDTGFAVGVKAFEALPRGSAVVIPETPAGWTLRLIKH